MRCHSVVEFIEFMKEMENGGYTPSISIRDIRKVFKSAPQTIMKYNIHFNMVDSDTIVTTFIGNENDIYSDDIIAVSFYRNKLND